MLVLVGAPGSGKTYFCRTIAEPRGYCRISPRGQPELEQCTKEAGRKLEEGRRASLPRLRSKSPRV